MDATTFDKFIWSFKNKSLTEDKIFILQRAAKNWWFTLDQFSRIVECLPKSGDKKYAIALLIQRIAGILTLSYCTSLIKQISISKDRMESFKLLLPYLDANRDIYSIQQFLYSSFDCPTSRHEALNLLKSHFKLQIEYPDVNFDEVILDESETTTIEKIKKCAKYASQDKRSVFDLPFISNLNVIKNMLLEAETKSQIEKEIARRIHENQHFLIPSKVSRILLNLRPDRKPIKNGQLLESIDNKKSITTAKLHDGVILETEEGTNDVKDLTQGDSIPNLHRKYHEVLDTDSVSGASVLSSKEIDSPKSVSRSSSQRSKAKLRPKNFIYNYFSIVSSRRNSASGR